MGAETDLRDRFQDPSEEHVQKLVDALNSLKEGELAVANLVACGKGAVEPLRRFLLAVKRRAERESREDHDPE